MKSTESLDLIVQQSVAADGSPTWSLCSPDVGFFSCPLPGGTSVSAGTRAGSLQRLGKTVTLSIPAGFLGGRHSRAIVLNDPEPAILHPVGYLTPLYEVRLLSDEQTLEVDGPEASSTESSQTFPAPQSGRFYHSPGPDSPPFIQAGDELRTGTPLGLIEVMKTFAQVTYTPDANLPPRVRMLTWLVEDGAEVTEGAPLLTFEPVA